MTTTNPYGIRTATIQGKPTGEPSSFPGVNPDKDVILAAIGVANTHPPKTEDLTDSATISGRGIVAFDVPTSGYRQIDVAVREPRGG